MKYKTCAASLKAATLDGDADAGGFEAIVSVFDNIDSMGDVVMRGAFKDSIATWKKSGDKLPVLWSHRMDDPMYNIGAVVDIAELKPNDPRLPEWVDDFVKEHGGLWVKGRIDTGDDATVVAKQALRLLRERRVTQFSYAYDVIDGAPVVIDGQDAYALKTLKLYEVSPTQVGANEMTELLAASASLPRKAAHELLSKWSAALGDALRAVDGDTTTSGEEKHDEPETVKCEEPAGLGVESFRLVLDRERDELLLGV